MVTNVAVASQSQGSKGVCGGEGMGDFDSYLGSSCSSDHIILGDTDRF